MVAFNIKGSFSAEVPSAAEIDKDVKMNSSITVIFSSNDALSLKA